MTIVNNSPFPNYEYLDDIFDGGYDWSCVGVFRRKSDGQVFYTSEGGCSCNGPWEESEEFYDFRPVSNLDAFTAAVQNMDIDSLEAVRFIAKWGTCG